MAPPSPRRPPASRGMSSSPTHASSEEALMTMDGNLRSRTVEADLEYEDDDGKPLSPH
ncbi:hypothetical protein ACP70R_015032 [Stipagrostis hirtigluma subsp. patula]